LQEIKIEKKKEKNLESASEGATRADLGTEEVDEVDQDADAEGDEADGGHGPGRGHVVEHQDAEVGERGGDDEGGDEEGGDGGGGDVGVGIWSMMVSGVRWEDGKVGGRTYQ
jgi:hypothetical protein